MRPLSVLYLGVRAFWLQNPSNQNARQHNPHRQFCGCALRKRLDDWQKRPWQTQNPIRYQRQGQLFGLILSFHIEHHKDAPTHERGGSAKTVAWRPWIGYPNPCQDGQKRNPC